MRSAGDRGALLQEELLSMRLEKEWKLLAWILLSCNSKMCFWDQCSLCWHALVLDSIHSTGIFSGLFAWLWTVLAYLLASGDSSAVGFCNRFFTPSYLWALENQAGRRQLEHFHLHLLVSNMGQSPGAVPYTLKLAALKVKFTFQ